LNTHKQQKKADRFIILIPHRDVLVPLDDYKAKLFAAGFPGAWSFPAAAPLALVSHPFSRDELKELAGNIRNLTRAADGKIQSSRTALVPCPGSFGPAMGSFFGLRLNFGAGEEQLKSLVPRSAAGKVLQILSPPVLCAALVEGSEENNVTAPALSFRAAALANLVIRPLNYGKEEPYLSYKWKISPPVWLPKL